MLPIPDSHALIVLLRLPVLGKVKSRIAKQAGAAMALDIYQSLVKLTLDMITGLQIPVYLMYEGGLPNEKVRIANKQYSLQPEGDLGKKISHAIETGLAGHSGVIVIGSDCPDLSVDLIREAFAQLFRHDMVLGPAADGGYYLIGCKNLYPGLFEDMAWGTDQVLSQTLQRCHDLKLAVYLLPVLHDVDTLEDWHRFSHTVPDAHHLRP